MSKVTIYKALAHAFYINMSESATIAATIPAVADPVEQAKPESTDAKSVFEALVSGNDPGDEVDGDATPEASDASESDDAGESSDSTEAETGDDDPLAGLNEQLAGLKQLLSGDASPATNNAKTESATPTTTASNDPDEFDKIAAEQWGDEAAKAMSKAVDSRVMRLMETTLKPIFDAIAPNIQFAEKQRISAEEVEAKNYGFKVVDDLVKSKPVLASLYGKDAASATPEQKAIRDGVYKEAKAIAERLHRAGKPMDANQIWAAAEAVVRTENAAKLTKAESRTVAHKAVGALDTRKPVAPAKNNNAAKSGASEGEAFYRKLMAAKRSG